MKPPRLGARLTTMAPQTRRRAALDAPRIPIERAQPDTGLEGPSRPVVAAKVTPTGGVLQGREASSWEMTIAKELEKRGLRYDFQVDVWGGRARAGGKVVDFLVYSFPRAFIRVQGTYWHKGSYEKNKDKVEKMLLQAQFPGMTIIDITEQEIEDLDLLHKMLAALGYM